MNSPIPADPGTSTCQSASQSASLNTSQQDGHRPAWRKPGIEVLPLSLTMTGIDNGDDGRGDTTGGTAPPVS